MSLLFNDVFTPGSIPNLEKCRKLGFNCLMPQRGKKLLPFVTTTLLVLSIDSFIYISMQHIKIVPAKIILPLAATISITLISKEGVNLEFRHLKAIFNWALSRGYIYNNPFTHIKPLKTPESDLPRFFELEEIEKVRKIFKNDPLEDLVEFYLITGARLKEALILTWDNIDMRRKQIKIPSLYTKAKKHRIISFKNDKKLETLLKKLHHRKDNKLLGPKSDDKQWPYEWVSKRISKVLTQNGFPWASCHTFRHTYISHLIMNGVPLTTVKEIVGHSSYTTTLKYSHLASGYKDEMIQKRPY